MKTVLSLLVLAAIAAATSTTRADTDGGTDTSDAAMPDAAATVDAATDTGVSDVPPLVPSNGDGHCTTSAPHGKDAGLSLLAIALAVVALRSRR